MRNLVQAPLPLKLFQSSGHEYCEDQREGVSEENKTVDNQNRVCIALQLLSPDKSCCFFVVVIVDFRFESHGSHVLRYVCKVARGVNEWVIHGERGTNFVRSFVTKYLRNVRFLLILSALNLETAVDGCFQQLSNVTNNFYQKTLQIGK